MEHQFFRKLDEGQIEEMVTMMREFYAIDQYPFNEDLTDLTSTSLYKIRTWEVLL